MKCFWCFLRNVFSNYILSTQCVITNLQICYWKTSLGPLYNWYKHIEVSYVFQEKKNLAASCKVSTICVIKLQPWTERILQFRTIVWFWYGWATENLKVDPYIYQSPHPQKKKKVTHVDFSLILGQILTKINQFCQNFSKSLPMPLNSILWVRVHFLNRVKCCQKCRLF